MKQKQNTSHQTSLPKAPSSLALSTIRDEGTTASLGNKAMRSRREADLFHCSIFTLF